MFYEGIYFGLKLLSQIFLISLIKQTGKETIVSLVLLNKINLKRFYILLFEINSNLFISSKEYSWKSEHLFLNNRN